MLSVAATKWIHGIGIPRCYPSDTSLMNGKTWFATGQVIAAAKLMSENKFKSRITNRRLIVSELKTEIPDMIMWLQEAADSNALKSDLRRTCLDAASFLQIATDIVYENDESQYGQEHVLATEKIKALKELYSTHQFG